VNGPFDHLNSVLERNSELERLMADPEVATQHKHYATLAREHSDIAPLVAALVDWNSLGEREAEALDLQQDPDPDMAEMAAEELEAVAAERVKLDEQIRKLLRPKDPNEGRNVILEIRAGTGGDEAAIFANDLLRMYTRFGETNGLKFEMMSSSATEQGGMREVTVLIKGKSAWTHLKHEAGTHRVQRVPVTETQGRVHTSAATVAVLPEAEEVDVQINDNDLRVDVFRASGPGGQSVNTTDSAVRLTHLPSGIVVIQQDEKSQHKNKAKALRVLRARVFELEQRKVSDERAELRRGMVGTGDRSEKIRTYNFPQNRVTDHRAGITQHNLDRVMNGDLQGLLHAVAEYFEAENLALAGS